MADTREPSASARLTAFNILQRHPRCVREYEPLNDLIDDIAFAIDVAALNPQQRQGE